MELCEETLSFFRKECWEQEQEGGEITHLTVGRGWMDEVPDTTRGEDRSGASWLKSLFVMVAEAGHWPCDEEEGGREPGAEVATDPGGGGHQEGLSPG